jgi:3-hydroxyisobutyrate dehydrogenase
MKLGVVGLGRMGRELALHLISAGHDVTVFNRTPGSARALVDAGASAASTAADAVADADAVVTVLFGPDAVREVVIDADIGIPAGALWIDATTISPDDADDFAAWSVARQVRYVHSPVLGSLAPARAGTLGVLLGGDSDAVEAASTIVALWADPTRVHRFDTPRQAAAAKLLVNLGLAVATEALGEALLLGRSSGLTDEAVLTVLDKTPLAGVVLAKGQTLREGSFEDAQFTVDALHKDAQLALRATGHPLPALAAAAESLARQQGMGRGDWDFSVMATEVAPGRASARRARIGNGHS